jgi:hypothetical protein
LNYLSCVIAFLGNGRHITQRTPKSECGQSVGLRTINRNCCVGSATPRVFSPAKYEGLQWLTAFDSPLRWDLPDVEGPGNIFDPGSNYHVCGTAMPNNITDGWTTSFRKGEGLSRINRWLGFTGSLEQ